MAAMMITPTTICCQKSGTFVRIRPLLIAGDDHDADRGADHAADAAEERGAADHHRGDRLSRSLAPKRPLPASSRELRIRPADAAGEAADHQREELHAARVDARVGRRLGVAAHRVDLQPELVRVSIRCRTTKTPIAMTAAPGKPPILNVPILSYVAGKPATACAVREQERDALRDAEHRERRDERDHPQLPGDQAADRSRRALSRPRPAAMPSHIE